MILLVSGTPGTGKTSVSKILSEKLNAKLVSINQLVKDKNLYHGIDPDKNYLNVDIDDLKEEMAILVFEEEENYPWIIFEGHLSHYFEQPDLVIVLRTRPTVLKGRLKKRGWGKPKIVENVEAEAIDICAWEASELHGSLAQEVDTSNLTPDEVVNEILKIISGEETHPVGKVNFLDELNI